MPRYISVAMADMDVFHHPHRKLSRDALADRVIWALIAAVVGVNLILMWEIATGGF